VRHESLFDNAELTCRLKHGKIKKSQIDMFGLRLRAEPPIKNIVRIRLEVWSN
jgi:hypothetical protein